MSYSIAQRFDNIVEHGRVFAPLSIGSPNMLHVTDRSVFKKSIAEKGQVLTMKKKLGKTKNHKFQTVIKGVF